MTKLADRDLSELYLPKAGAVGCATYRRWTP